MGFLVQFMPLLRTLMCALFLLFLLFGRLLAISVFYYAPTEGNSMQRHDGAN